MAAAPTQTKRANLSGFTLLELLVALMIAIILIAMAVPSFHRLQLRSALQSQAELVFRLTQASRAAALDTATNITLCGTENFGTCIKDDFRSLMAFHDANNSGEREADEPVLYQYSLPITLSLHLRTPPHMRQNWLKYRYAEADANPYGSLYLCARKREVNLGQRVAVSNVGRNRLGEAQPFETDECAAATPAK